METLGRESTIFVYSPVISLYDIIKKRIIHQNYKRLLMKAIGNQDYLNYSHFEYQFSQAKSYIDQESLKQEGLSFASSLNNQAMATISLFLKEGKHIIVSHNNPTPLPVDTVSSLLNFLNPSSFTILKKEEQIFRYIAAQKKKQQNQEIQTQIIYLSLYGYIYLEYKPWLIKLLRQAFAKKAKMVIQIENIQAQQVRQTIQNLQCKQLTQQFQQLQIGISMPYEYVISENLFDILEKFLTDQAKKMNKKDVVIFHEPTEQFKKKLFYLIRTKGFHVFCSIIYQGSTQQENKNESFNKIIIASSVDSLLKQKYDLSQVYLILDYCQNTYRYFNYSRCCYYEAEDKISYKQVSRRATLRFGSIGEYACHKSFENITYITDKEQKKYLDYGNYCLSMVSLELTDYLQLECKTNNQLKACLQALRSNGVLTKQNKLKNQQILLYTRNGVNPIIAQAIIQAIQNQQLDKAKLLLLTQVIISSKNLRKTDDSTNPITIWHKTGYLESCLILILGIQNFEMTQSQQTVSIDKIAYNYQIQPQIFKYIVREQAKLSELMKLNKKFSFTDLEEQTFHDLLETLITIFKPAVGTFSGSRRLGYFFKGSKNGMLAHRDCLMSYYNEKPNFIIATKILLVEGQENFLDCNYIRDDVLVSTYGCLPTISRQSFGECQVEFLNVSSAVFNHLSKHRGIQIEIFQKQNDCSLEANSQLNIITIQCSKLRQKQINDKFTVLLQQINSMFKKETKSFKQSRLLRIILSSGGQIAELLMSDQASDVLQMCRIKNLAPEVGLIELKELFDEFIQLKDIKTYKSENTNTNEAIIYFYSPNDYRKFSAYFSGCNYYDHSMIIQSYTEDSKVFPEQRYLLFEWNVWKSLGEAIIQFENPESAHNCINNLKSIGGKNIKIEQKLNILFIQGLNNKIDEKDLRSWVSGLGKITNIEVRRYPTNKTNKQKQAYLQQVFSNAFPKDNFDKRIGEVLKMKNGNRSCKVIVPNHDRMNEVFFVLNESYSSVFGTKLYVTPVFTYPVTIPQLDEGYVNVYLDIIQNLSIELGRIQTIETELIQEPLKWTLIIKSNSQDQITIIKNSLPSRLIPIPLRLSSQNSSMMFSQTGLNNLKKIQKKWKAKVIVDFVEKRIKILCKSHKIDLIEKQINNQIMESFTYDIALYQKSYLYLQKNIQQILSAELQKGIKYKFESITKKLFLQGNLITIEKCKDKINKSLIALKAIASQSNYSTENICGLCCQQFKHPFKLQACGHTFCIDCLQSSIKVTIQDITLYPVKCPECMQKIWVSDLDCLLDKQQWDKIIQISINHFIFSHPGQYTFCLTPGCTFICNIQFKQSYNCPECKKGYCLNCKNLIHDGMTCHQARYGSDRLFNDYMLNVGGRICAYKSCKAPIERISGCFKVQCSRCKKCMCFKCPANSMIPYDTPQQTYNHMNRAHGGCF